MSDYYKVLFSGSSPLDANLPYADDFHPSNELDVPVLNSEAATSTDKGSNKSAESKNNAEYEYNRILSDINEKHREEEEINAILQDWKLLAQKVDYILFWVFLALTTISSCIFIFILPYYKRGKLLWKLQPRRTHDFLKLSRLTKKDAWKVNFSNSYLFPPFILEP